MKRHPIHTAAFVDHGERHEFYNDHGHPVGELPAARASILPQLTSPSTVTDLGRQAMIDLIRREAPLATEDMFRVALGFVDAMAEGFGAGVHPDDPTQALRTSAHFARQLADQISAQAIATLEKHGAPVHDA